MLFAIAHELTHFIRQNSPAKFDALADIVVNKSNLKGKISERIEQKLREAEDRGEPISRDTAYEKVIADSMETILTSGRVLEMMNEIQQQDKTLWEQIRDWFMDFIKSIREAYKGVDADTVEGQAIAEMDDVLKELEQVFAEGLVDAGEKYTGTFAPGSKSAENKKAKDTAIKAGLNYLSESSKAMREAIQSRIIDNPEVNQKVLYSDRISELTEDEVYRLIENSNHGEYALDTFVPVRRDTPPLLVELSKKDGLPPVKNLPIIMNVEHIQQCMDEEVAANDGKRGHALTTENIIEIVKGLDSPRYVFFQKDNKRYCEVVEYDVGKKGEKALAIVTYTGNKNQDLMNGYPGREYNILVTAYPPDAKYWKDYQKSSNNVLIYDKTKDAPQGSYGSHVPSLLSGSPFATKVTHTKEDVKQYSDRDSESVSNRSLLANALEGVAQNEWEQNKLNEYKENIAKVEEMESRLQEINSQLYPYGKKMPQKERIALQDEAVGLRNKITNIDKKLLRLEATKPLQNVLNRERARVRREMKQKAEERISEVKAEAAQRMKRRSEGHAATEMRKKIRKTIRELDKILNRGDKKRNVKEDMKDRRYDRF